MEVSGSEAGVRFLSGSVEIIRYGYRSGTVGTDPDAEHWLPVPFFSDNGKVLSMDQKRTQHE
jgi:hypothetical protein